MNGKQLQRLLDDAGMSQRGAARDIGIGERTMRSYIAGDLEVPLVVEYALRHLIGTRKGVDQAAGKVSASGNTIAFAVTVSKHEQNDQLVMKGLTSGKQLFLTTIANDRGARGHRHLYGHLIALMEGRK